MNHLSKARRVIQLEIDELENLLQRIGEEFSDAIEMLRSAVADGRKIIVVGIGKSHNIGYKIAATLNSTGATAVVLNSQNALHGDLGVVCDGDVVLALSYSGETAELLELLPALRRFNVRVISMTGEPESSLARNSDLILDTRVSREACPLNLAPTSSSTVMLVLGDALAMVLLESRGFQQEDFARLHPGGSLGKALLTKVSDIMRSGDSCAMVSPDTTVRATLEQMTAVRSGAAVVRSEEGELAGIFTQGDFVRAIQKDQDILDQPVFGFMTKNPVTIPEDKLAAEVIPVLSSHRIDDLVVINGDHQPVGLVDSQDLSRLKLV
ncbi:MAG: KpsF/GutQ family sugar-phosphate isomerase [Verrucomicrobiales bacterium]|nr:KpsF/GutQ family sugar-phosphate isomerase [Verrucomicrobiales bacterium]MED5585894.1 KpsF/GutQ family sugar-phosphate isomerase [Verrucomicrobiota bacterium]